MSFGGTIVTWYGSHSSWHAAGTLSIGVVVRTDAHALVAADGDADGVVDARGVGVDAAPLHPAISRQNPPNTVRVTNRTWAPLASSLDLLGRHSTDQTRLGDRPVAVRAVVCRGSMPHDPVFTIGGHLTGANGQLRSAPSGRGWEGYPRTAASTAFASRC